MYTSLHIQNFRGLRDLRLDDLARVNLIVGANNVGKTSLLEALWLFQGAGNPALTVSLAHFRGYELPPSTAEGLWLGLFHRFESDRSISIEGIQQNGERHSLVASLEKEQVLSTSLSGNGRGGERAGLSAPVAVPNQSLRYRFESSGMPQPVVTTATIVGSGTLKSEAAELDLPGAVLIRPAQGMATEDVAILWTRALDGGFLDSVIASLRSLEPRLSNLTLGLSEPGEPPIVRGHLEGIDHPVPLPLFGGGTRRLFELLLGISKAREGLALVDEIEVGIHYRQLKVLWQAIDEASREFNVQLFATTHSWECASIAAEVFQLAPGDFRLFRLERSHDSNRVVSYDHEVALAAATGRVEVR